MGSEPEKPADPGAATVLARKLAKPAVDARELAVAQARIGNKLFETAERVQLGRYQLLEEVGSGGMGVVWGAWDPELERRVAIKLVKAEVRAARERILGEGQALAKLSHPNVVPVYDVGVVGDEVYLVMEWVRGTTLRELPRRSARELVATYRGAGEGLAAAHAAGLVHRDFKPENAVIGDDGRVRVLDFGLARGEVEGEIAGTPRYMAPEQVRGGTVTAAADQYAFCVSLQEALVEVPRWLEGILARGRAEEPGERFPDMRALLDALARDPRTVWRRRVLVAGVCGVAVAAFAAGNLREAKVELCDGGTDEIAASWNESRAGVIRARLATLGPYGAEEAPRIVQAMTEYAQGWATAHGRSCHAHERAELTAPIYERTLACLTRARAAFHATTEVLETTPADRLSKAIEAVHGLPDAAACAAQSLTSTIDPPPRQIAPQVAALDGEIARVRVLVRADDPTAVAIAKLHAERTDALHYAPLAARAHLAYGFALMGQQDFANAIAPLERAAQLAIDARDDEAFVESFARQIYVVAMSSREDVPVSSRDVFGGFPIAERVAMRLGEAGVIPRSLLFNNIGAVLQISGDLVGARRWYDRALAEPVAIRTRDVELAGMAANRALVAETAMQRDRWFAEARDALGALVGETHSKTLNVRHRAAMWIAHPGKAAGELRGVCALYRRLHPTLLESIDDCLFELGWLAYERGDRAEARDAMSSIRPGNQLAAAFVIALDGGLDDAARRATELAAAPDSTWWALRDAADAQMLAANCHAQRGRRRAAAGAARTALEFLDRLTAVEQTTFYGRRRARANLLLARVTEDEASARAAQAWYRAAGGYDSTVAELERLITGAR